jgi:hypothetical protein
LKTIALCKYHRKLIPILKRPKAAFLFRHFIHASKVAGQRNYVIMCKLAPGPKLTNKGNHMKTLKLNSKLLSVLQLIQYRKQLALVESQLELTSDWYSDTRSSFFSLPDDLISEVGLVKNEFCFRAIESLTVPKEWLSTEASLLNKFEFSY